MVPSSKYKNLVLFPGSKHSKFQGEVEEESVYPKKIAHKKKGNKKHNVDTEPFEEQQSKILGKVC